MAATEVPPTSMSRQDELARLDSYFRAANYLTAGQIYLMDNPLLRRPLRPEDIKPRLLGPLGNQPRPQLPLRPPEPDASRASDLDAIFVCGPGHGGPAVVANTWLEGTYSERYPHVARDGEGMARLFRQFSFPGGIPSHCSPETPGSIHEGGELGYSLSHAFGAAFDNPDLVVACVVGDGEAETGPAATGWHSNKFLDPRRDGVGAAHPPPQRVQDRRPDRAGPDTRPPSSWRCSPATATTRCWSRAASTARTTWPSTTAWPPRSTTSSPRSTTSRTAHASHGDPAHVRPGRC